MWVAALLLAGSLYAVETGETTAEKAPEIPANPFELQIPLGEAEDSPSIKLRFFGQNRTRAELRTPGTYAPGLAEQRVEFAINMRNRLGVDAFFPGSAGVLFELQDVRLFGDEPRANANSVNSSGFEGLDVLQAYLYSPNLFDAGIDARLGRQKFVIGNQRLFSTLEWAPQSRAWDGLTLQRSFDDQYHLLGMALLVNELNRVQDDEWLLGLSFRWTPEFLKQNELEALVLSQHRDDAAGSNDAHFTTASLRWNGRFGLSDGLALAFTAEGVTQWGTADSAFWGTPGLNDANVLAFAAAATLDLHWSMGDHTLRWGIEWDYASGDSNPADNDFQTFRSPFPFGHKYQGFADQVGWRNLHAFSAVVEWALKLDGWVESLGVLVHGHAFQRENDDDGWYSPAGGLIRAGSPDVSDELGYELDITVSLKLTRWVAFEAGWAHFFAGRFVKQTAVGGGSAGEESDMEFGWAQISLQF
jgi:hypothetical protein